MNAVLIGLSLVGAASAQVANGVSALPMSMAYGYNSQAYDSSSSSSSASGGYYAPPSATYTSPPSNGYSAPPSQYTSPPDVYSAMPYSSFQSGGYKSMYTDSNMSLEALSNTKTAYGGAGEVHGGKSKEDYRHDKRASHQPKRASKMPPSSDLFFSPTNNGANSNSGANRTSTYMPAGYYAPGASQANSGNPIAHLGRGAEGAGYGRLASRDGLATPSPPGSPSLRPQSRPQSTHLRPGSAAGLSANPRHSSRLSTQALAQHDAAQGKKRSRLGESGDFSLNAPPIGRTPSTYLEDLFENHGHAG